MTKLWGCKVFNGSIGGVIERGCVEFAADKIVEVEALAADAEPPVFSAELIDARGLTALPGYIDTECHLVQDSGPDAFVRMGADTTQESMFNTMRNSARYLRKGFTTIRDLGDRDYDALKMRDKVNEGKVMGPRIVVTGPVIRVTKGHGRGYEINGPYEARQATREHLSHKVDWVKIMATSSSIVPTQYEAGAIQMLYDEIEAVCTVARNYGKPVAAHAHSEETILNCLKAGVITIEHCTSLTDRVIEMLLEKQAWAVPTFTPYAIMTVDESGLTSATMKAYCQRVMEVKTKCFARAVEAGVNIAFGTDAGAPMTPHGDSYYELSSMVQYGMSLEQALASMSSMAARLLQMDDRIGSLKPGYLADITVVKGDPFADLHTIENIAYVYKGGELMCKDNNLLDKGNAPLYSPPPMFVL